MHPLHVGPVLRASRALSHRTLAAALYEVATGDVPTTTSTSYFYVKGLQQGDIPVLSSLLFLPTPRTPIFYVVVYSNSMGRLCLAGVEGRPGVSGTSYDAVQVY